MPSIYVDSLGVADLTLTGLDAPFTERCEGCDGTGHLGHRVPAQVGPCESCLGTGRIVFGFTSDGRYAVAALPHEGVSWLMSRYADD